MKPEGGEKCIASGRYCSPSPFYGCGNETEGKYFKSCYFGRGAIQISYNYNYGQFGEWLKTQNISADLITHPNLVLTKRDPPLALLASLWFYMSPQPPKPAMHDIILDMPKRFDQIPQNVSWEPDWSTTWRDDNPCQCAPATYAGLIPYYQPGFYPPHFVNLNEENRQKCEQMLREEKYAKLFGLLDRSTTGCLNFTENKKEENLKNKFNIQLGTNTSTNLMKEDNVEKILDLSGL
uniref:Glycoside hydrolase family 19 catalytic domain-containing protein n=1 Tax=Meloidogyne enterolobii TaxID=390850 RepID=A0A6V7UML9_MELEN|nr:unnamed protein product [Meloidogyne enterolobii]